MRLHSVAVYGIFVILLFLLDCGKKSAQQFSSPSAHEALPPEVAATDAPEFVRRLDLLYPQAVSYRVENNFLQKTNHPLKEILRYYEEKTIKNNFKAIARLEQKDGALLQSEKEENSIKETLSVDIQKLPYADNYLIRIGHSRVDYTSLKKGEP